MVRTPISKRRRRKVIKPKVLRKYMLSDLPTDVLHLILSKLSTKDSIRTSVMSRGWENLWSHVPSLDLAFRDFEDNLELGKFIDKYMKSNHYLEKFRLIYDFGEYYDDDSEALVRMPLSLYSCATLVDLTLCCVTFGNSESESVSLPRLKSLYLGRVKFDGDSLLETLVSSCSVLEDLTVITHPDVEVVCIRSQSLKCFTIKSRLQGFEDAKVEIDVPRLEYLSITDNYHQPESFVIHNIGSSAKLNLGVWFNTDPDDDHLYGTFTRIRNFLISISIFKEMTVSAQTLKTLHIYSQLYLEPLPRFHNLSRLEASLVDSSWESLQVFLSCCMNLRSLTLELDRLPDEEELKQYPLPQCVVSSLEYIKVKLLMKGSENILAIYVWNNCPALKKVEGITTRFSLQKKKLQGF